MTVIGFPNGRYWIITIVYYYCLFSMVFCSRRWPAFLLPKIISHTNVFLGRKVSIIMKKINLAVVGATGMVGRTFLKVLEERHQPIENFYVMASSRSAGSKLTFNGKRIYSRRTDRTFFLINPSTLPCSPQAAAPAKNSLPSQQHTAVSLSTTALSGVWIPKFLWLFLK